jgi:hypothetical protein
VEKYCHKALSGTYLHMSMSTMSLNYFDLNNPHVLHEEEVWKLMVLDIFEDVEEETLVVR